VIYSITPTMQLILKLVIHIIFLNQFFNNSTRTRTVIILREHLVDINIH
jgi:hypothetical protein